MYSQPEVSRSFVGTASGRKEIVVIQSGQLLKSTGSKPTTSDAAPGSTAGKEAESSNVHYELQVPPTPPLACSQITVSSASGKLISLAGAPPRMTPSGAIKRPLQYDFSANVRKFPRTSDKSKGLRHFSTKVCDKVREKGVTNYNEVADELVQEYFESATFVPSSQEKQLYDQKNIRRRVYDALNVLMAMNIITKEKKEIRWLGLPTSSVQECIKLEEEKAERVERIKQKSEQLKDLVSQLVSMKALIERNKMLEASQGKPLPHTTLSLPYVIVTTDKRTEVDCSISQDKTEYLFKFNQPFEIQEDSEILKRLGLSYGLETGNVHPDSVPRMKGYLPLALRDYVDDIINGTLLDRFLPISMQSKRSLLLARTFDRFEERSRSLDAADMEVAFTLSKNESNNATNLRSSHEFQHSYFAPSKKTPSHGLTGGSSAISPFRASLASHSSRNGSSLSAPFRASDDRPEEDDEEDEDEDDFTDFESIGSNSNQGY